jgi:GGDEF domain-containing protein
MSENKLPKQECDRIGRSFSLLFNRSTMYQLEHPYTSQSIHDFFKTISKALRSQASLVVIMNREQFFVEDEPLDPRLNLSRMVSHFKKAGVQSISFQRNLRIEDISEFVRVFIDLTSFADVDAMRRELQRVGVDLIKINHVVYKKVTEDDAVVSKSALSGEGPESTGRGQEGPAAPSMLDVMASGLVMQELEQAMSLRLVIDNPGAASRSLIESDLAAAQQTTGGGAGQSGPVILDQLNRLRSEVDKVAPEMAGASLAEMAEAVFDMKRKLLSGIEAQKTSGVVYADENLIRQEADNLTDKVFIQLVKDEYRQGAISVSRLAQILRRLVPDPQELQRLMPALKQTLLEEGMAPEEYAQLVAALSKELQSQGLAQVIKEGAEAIGVDGEDLIQEVLSNPQIAAELIYLATEMRRGGSDEKVLSELLVDYVERVGQQLTLAEVAADGEGDTAHMERALRRIQTQIVDRLKTKDLKSDVLQELEDRLKGRMEAMMAKLQTAWGKQQTLPAGVEELKRFSILGSLEAGTEDDEDLTQIMTKVRSGLRARGVEEDNFQEIYRELLKGKIAWKKQQEKKDLPGGVLNRSSILFFVEKEMQRALRYGTPFSVVLFALIRAVPREKVPAGALQQKEVYQATVERLAQVVRDPDMVGAMDASRMIWLLPMTMPNDVQTARERILGELHRHIYTVNGVPLKVRLASAVMDFSHEEMPSLQTFLKRAERKLHEMVVRLRNIRELM